jgi:hypothetical protein
VISQSVPVTLKSEAVKPVTLSEKVKPYSKVVALVGVLGEVTVTVGAVLSITTSAAELSALGPVTVPTIELASSVSL